jgi:hypothetical protein
LKPGGTRLFFIDGVHDITNCLRDMNTVFKWIKKGDVIVFHDYRERKVMKVIGRQDWSGYDTHVVDTRRKIYVAVKKTDAVDNEVPL